LSEIGLSARGYGITLIAENPYLQGCKRKKILHTLGYFMCLKNILVMFAIVVQLQRICFDARRQPSF